MINEQDAKMLLAQLQIGDIPFDDMHDEDKIGWRLELIAKFCEKREKALYVTKWMCEHRSGTQCAQCAFEREKQLKEKISQLRSEVTDYSLHIDKLQSERTWLSDKVERLELKMKTDEELLIATIESQKAEIAKWKRIRTPTHGSCCTCQACGAFYDDCRCDLDDMADDVVQLQKTLEKIFDCCQNRYGPCHDWGEIIDEIEGIIQEALEKK